MTSEPCIFVGFELTGEVSEGIANCSERDQIYLEDPAFLETVTIDCRKYIGKRAKNDIAIDRLEDIARSVVSIMARVSTNWTMKSDDALILAAEEGEPEADEITRENEPGQPDSFDYSGLVD